MTAPDTSPEAVNKVCNALAGLCVTHPHFAAPGQAMELLHQMSLALTASEKRLDWLIEAVNWREFYDLFDLNVGSYTTDDIRARIDAELEKGNG